VNKDKDVEDTLHQLSFDFRDIENELLDERIKHETMVAPMQEYIEIWLKNAMIKITKPDQQKAVTTIMEPQSKHSTKGTSTSK
jgi:hypothetical protein